MRFFRNLKLLSLIKFFGVSTSRTGSVIPITGIFNSSPRRVDNNSSQQNQGITTPRIQPDRTNPVVCAEFVYGPVAVEPPQVQAQINLDNSFGTEPEVELVIENSKYNYSPFIPFDYHKSQSPENPDNSHWQPRYDNMIFFDPKENSDSPSDQTDYRRKKFLTVISANSISPPASPSPSPHKQTIISNDDIQNNYQKSLNTMKLTLIEIEKMSYPKAEIIEACQYARQFKGIMYGRDGVIKKLKYNYPQLKNEAIELRFEKLKNISSLFQKKCWDNKIYSGRDENSLKSEYKLSAEGKNNRPGLRLTYIPQEALEMFKNHNATQAQAVVLSVKPDTPRGFE
jgi:hypothetical protein